MKIYMIILALVALLNASEFTHIQPIAVEDAPIKKAVVVKEEVVEEVAEEVEEEDEIFEESFVEQSDDGSASLKVNFATRRYNIDALYEDTINEFANYLKEHSEYQVVIYGHTDNRGAAKSNLKLSKNRANSVKEALQKKGISSTRITTIAKGESEPVAGNMYKKERAKNRRIEIDILK